MYDSQIFKTKDQKTLLRAMKLLPNNIKCGLLNRRRARKHKNIQKI